jgi:hypothetical protein
MDVTPKNSKHIDLGNGYGYFCNIHDIENPENNNKSIHKYDSELIKSLYYETLYFEDDPDIANVTTSTTACADTICSVIIIAFVFMIGVFVL